VISSIVILYTHLSFVIFLLQDLSDGITECRAVAVVVVVVVSCCVPICFCFSSCRRVAPFVYYPLFHTDVSVSAKPALLVLNNILCTYSSYRAFHDVVPPTSVSSELFPLLGYRILRSHNRYFNV